MKTREQLIKEAERQGEEIAQYFRDVEHWNQTRGKEEGTIDADPDGSMQVMARGLAEFLEKNKLPLPRDIWKDPEVQAALKEGRPADDIAVLACPNCDEWGYYNEGSHFSCRFCERTWECISEDETPPDGPYLNLQGRMTLVDTITEVTEGYDNRTRPKETL